MATDGYTLATAYIQLMPSMRGVAAETRKQFGGIETAANNTAKRVSSKLSQSFSDAHRSATGLAKTVSAIGGLSKDAAKETLKFGANLTRGMRTGAVDGLAASFGALGRSGVQAVGSIVSKLPGVTKGAQLVSSALSATARPFTNLARGFQSSAAAASSFTGTMGTLGGKARSVLDGTINKVGALGRSFAAPAKNFAAGFSAMNGGVLEFSGRMGNLGVHVGRALNPAINIAKNLGGAFQHAGSVIMPAMSKAVSGVTQMVSGAVASVRNLASAAVSAVSSIANKVADTFRGPATAAVTAAIAGITVALTKGLGRLNAIDTAQAKLRGLGNDADAVKEIMNNATKAVEGTAYGLDAAATAAAAGVAAGIKPGEALQGHLTRIANNAAAAGVSMEEMGATFNKAATQANGVQNDVISQLADKGIPIYQALADQMGVTAGEVFKMASEGKVDFETFSAAAEKAAGTVADEMGKTLPGALKNLMASVGRIGANLWKGLELDDGTYTGIYSKLTGLVTAITKALKPIEALATTVGNAIGEKLGPPIQWVTDKLTAFAESGSNATEKFKPLLTALAPAGAMFAALGAGGLASLLGHLGPLVGLLGPLPGLLSAIGGPLGIATVGLIAFSKVDPSAMASGLSQMAQQIPAIFQKINEVVVDFAFKMVPSFLEGVISALPVLVRGISSMIGALLDSLITFLPRLVNSALALFMGLVEAFGEIVPILVVGAQMMIKQIVDKLPTLIPMLVQAAIRLFMGIVDGLMKVVDPLIKAVVDLIPTLITALTGMIGPLVEGAVTLFMALVEAIPRVVVPLVTAVYGMVPQVITGLTAAIPVLLDGAVQLFMGIVSAIPVVLPPLLDAVVGLIPVIIDGLLSTIDALIQGAVMLFTGIINAIPIILPPLVTAVIDMIPVIIEALLGMITQLLDGAVQLFTALVEAIPLIIPPLLVAVVELIPQIVTSLLSMLPTLIEGAVTLFMGIVSAVPQIVTELVAAIGALIPEMVAAIGEAGPRMVQAGKDLMGGLAKGIGEAAGAVWDGIKEVGGGIVGGFKDFFGIKSPSRVMATLGGYLDAGLANGVGGGGAVKASQSMSAQVKAPVDAMQNAFRGASSTIRAQVNQIMAMMNQLINLMTGSFRTVMSREINAVARLFQVTLPNAVRSAVTAMRAAMGGFSTWTGGAFRQSIVGAATAIKGAFTALPGAIVNAWSRIKAGTANPTNYVISTVYMQGIRSAVNAITSAVGLSLSMPAVRRVPGYATGGVLPGYTPGRDIYTFVNPETGQGIRLGGGEAILRPEVTRALGEGTINAWNRTRGKALSNVGDLGQGKVSAFANGGIFQYLQGNGRINTSATSFVDDVLDAPKVAINTLVTNPARNTAARNGGGAWGASAGNSMVNLAGQFENVFAKRAESLGNTAAVTAARKYLGVPYVWGGSSVPPGLDCSGLVYKAFSDIGKQIPRLTAAGYQSAARPVGTPRRGDLAFWGDPAYHVGIMTAANSMIHAPKPGDVVKNAPLYGSPTFGRLKYDQGGLLPTGFTLVENRSGKPERVFNEDQWKALQNRGSGPMVVKFVDADGVFRGYIRGEISESELDDSQRFI